MIINIRGTSGSGKTHLVRELMSAMTDLKLIPGDSQIGGLATHYPKNKESKAIGYSGTLTYPDEIDHRVHVVGRYETACGGCDTIKTQDEICDRVRAFATRGDVVFEGLLVSVLYDRYRKLCESLSIAHHIQKPVQEAVLGRDQETFPPFIFAFLDTPEEVCVQRVKDRRAAAGNDKPLNENNTREKWHICQRVAEKLNADGLPVVWLNHENALSDLTMYLKGVI